MLHQATMRPHCDSETAPTRASDVSKQRSENLLNCTAHKGRTWDDLKRYCKVTIGNPSYDENLRGVKEKPIKATNDEYKLSQ